MNSVKQIQSLCRVGQLAMRNNIRQMSAQKLPTAAEIEAQREKNIPKDLHPMFYKLKKDQKLYQQADGVPVHFKRGARDKVLYYLTIALLCVGMGGCAEFVYHLP